MQGKENQHPTIKGENSHTRFNLCVASTHGASSQHRCAIESPCMSHHHHPRPTRRAPFREDTCVLGLPPIHLTSAACSGGVESKSILRILYKTHGVRNALNLTIADPPSASGSHTSSHMSAYLQACVEHRDDLQQTIHHLSWRVRASGAGREVLLHLEAHTHAK